jgi:hypothetical protein
MYSTNVAFELSDGVFDLVVLSLCVGENARRALP